MANRVDDVTIHSTPKGVKVKLDSIYLYSDGNAHIVFDEGINLPCERHFDVIIQLATLLRRMQAEVERKQRQAGTP